MREIIHHFILSRQTILPGVMISIKHVHAIRELLHRLLVVGHASEHVVEIAARAIELVL